MLSDSYLSIVGIKGILRNHMLRQMSVGQP